MTGVKLNGLYYIVMLKPFNCVQIKLLCYIVVLEAI